MLNLKLYSAFRNQLFSGMALLISILLFFIPVNLQFGKPFNLQLFFLELILMSLTSVFVFYFLRNLFCPVVQVYKSEVIISKYRRLSVPKKMIRELVLDKGRVKVLYLEGKELKEIIIAVRKKENEDGST